MNTASALHAQHCASATFAAIATALVAGLAPTALAGGDVIYENDFATRSSAGAVPYGEWRTVAYSAGTFLADDYNSPFSGNAFQDNWIRGKNACNCPAHIVDDNGNTEVVMHNAADMGATHPTPATATPAEPVATFADVKFRMAAANLGGVSSLCVSAMGTMDNTVNETVGAYWDNIQIRYRPQNPFTIVIR